MRLNGLDHGFESWTKARGKCWHETQEFAGGVVLRSRGDACEQAIGDLFRKHRRNSITDEEHPGSLGPGEPEIIGESLKASTLPQGERTILVRMEEFSNRTTRDCLGGLVRS